MNAGSWVARRRPVSFEPVGHRGTTGPRFARFAAAMEAAPPPSAQVLPDAPDMVRTGPVLARPRPVGPVPVEHIPAGAEAAEPRIAQPFQAGPRPVGPAQASAEPADVAAAPRKPEAATAAQRRPVIEGAGRSRSDVPWLGIGSWLLLCAALFASLLGWPGQTALDRIAGIWPGDLSSTVLGGRTGREEPTQPTPTPAQNQPATAPDRAANAQPLPPVEQAPPIRSDAASDTVKRAPGGPPVPQFKPSVDRVAAEFSNAFFEMGQRLQQEGDLAAAGHMRRQGVKLDPWKTPAASDL